MMYEDNDGKLRYIDDAKTKAQKLADASGAKLGRIASVRDDGAAPKQESETSNLAMMIYGAVAHKPSAEEAVLSGGTSGELTLHVNLTVQFEIAK